ncbi:FhaA domain-containing protein [Microlunatus sp. GCM10028923]|uniref:FhaA domain-containing protein n=1 Tax=Microlunatus sp. GCM10028923 TaxID=3273400 RepID=UPI00361BB247
MGIFQRFEKKVEGAVNGVFARAFKGDVQPVEIAARLLRELDAEAKLMSRDKRLVPNEFVIGLSQHDHDKLAPYSKTLSAELSTELKAHARDMGYQFNGPIRIHLELNESLPVGRFTVASEAVSGAGGDTPATITAINRAQLVLEVNGMRHPLQPPGLIIGRGSEADLRVNDPGISRRHAEIRVVHHGATIRVEIVDLGSTNGIVVDGRRVRQAQLADGSRIEIGQTRMLVHAPAGR